MNNSILKTLAFLRLKISQSLGIPFVLPKPLGRTKGRVFSLLTTHCLCGTGFQPAVESTTIIRRQMLSHFPTVTQSTGFQPEPLLITHSSLFKLETLWNLLKRFSSFKGVEEATLSSTRLRLEAYTLSNQGRILRMCDINKISWLEASTNNCLYRHPHCLCFLRQ